MFDTVKLQIPRGRYEIIDHSKFIPPTIRMLENKLPYFKYVNNPISYDKSLKIYKPKMTIYKRGAGYYLVIELSAPKVIFNNNVDELENKNFDEVLKKLKEKLFAMGVEVNLNSLKYAQVLALHPSKNIQLSRGYTSTFAMRELAKIDISKKFDISKIKFKNNIEESLFYTKSHSLVFYDKIADLEKAENRAVDKQQTKYQKSLFDYLKEKQRIELLRMEVRLSEKRKMNEILKEVGYSPDPLFKDIFKKDLCQKILNLYWTKYFSDNPFIYSTHNDPQEILQKIFMIYPKMKNPMAYKYVGLYMLCKAEQGIRGLRQIIESRRIYKVNWELAKREFEKFEDKIFSNSVWGFLQDIKRELKEFKPFRLKK